MNKSKINDFINLWAEVVGLTGEENKKYRNFIKTDIARRCEMYEQVIPTVSTKDDSCNAYLIKPVNGEYSLEDFLLNRLMIGLRDVDFTGALEGNGGEYVAHNKVISVNIDMLDSLARDKAKRHIGLQGKNVQIVQKTIEHELGHCYKSLFNDGFKAPLGNGRKQDEIYKKLINSLSKFENGKYASQIKSLKDFDLEEYSSVIKTGVTDSKVNYSYDYRIEFVDELLNETEALELINSNDIHDIWPLQDENGKNSTSGNYVNVYNYLSGYRSFTGYGPILKSLLGKENTFRAEYISSVDIFKQFDQEYADIVQDVWGLDPQIYPPMKCIFMDFDDLLNKKHFDENIILKLDDFFAKCYERKVEKIVAKGNGNLSPKIRESILGEIETFQSRLTTNDEPNKRDALAHNVIFNNITTRVNELSIQNSQPRITEDDKAQQKEVVQQDNQQSGKIDSQKIKFIQGFIQAYDDTEEKYQYEKRASEEQLDIERVQEIIKTNGLNRMLTSDIEGKWLGTPQDKDFKVQYSQKQVSAMVQLLKAAQLLTDNKKLNTTSKNYLEEFSGVADIEYKLKQMKNDLKDNHSYMFELKNKAIENRISGNIPNFPKTDGEIDISTNSSNSGQVLKQEMGITQAQADEKQKNKYKGEKYDNQKISIKAIKDLVEQSKVTKSELYEQTKNMSDITKIKSLKFKQICGVALNQDEQNLLNEHIRQTNQIQQEKKKKSFDIRSIINDNVSGQTSKRKKVEKGKQNDITR